MECDEKITRKIIVNASTSNAVYVTIYDLQTFEA